MTDSTPATAADCPHMSASGDEGPVEQLGRSPYRWRCDGCAEIFYTCRACGCSPEQHDPACLHKCSGWFAEGPPDEYALAAITSEPARTVRRD